MQLSKKMKLSLMAVLFPIVVLSATARASDYVQLTGVGIMNFSNPTLSSNGNSVAHSGRTVYGFGGLISFPLVPMFRLETGLLYLPHSFTVAPVDTTITTFNLPVMVRWTLLPFLSFGGGAFLGFGTGNPTDYNGVTGVSTSPSQSKNYSKSDFGFVLSAALDLPLAPMTSIILDARYLLGVKNLDNTANQTFKTGGFMLLAGLRFGL